MITSQSYRALDLSKYIANKQHSQTVYDLYAVCNHSGSQEEGHCKPSIQITIFILFSIHNYYYYFSSDTAYCKNQFTGKWYCFDDEEVSEISEDSVCVSGFKTNLKIIFFNFEEWVDGLIG